MEEMALNQKGLTIFEVLIVIVLLAIVAGVSYPVASRTLENTQKDTVLQQAREIEYAAGEYCRSIGHHSCETGDVLLESQLDDFVNNIEDDYAYFVRVQNLRAFEVVYAKEGELSFPYDEDGIRIVSGKVPSSGEQDHVHRAQHTPAIPDEDEESDQEASSWSTETTYTEGEEVIHNGTVYYAQWWTEGTEPGTDPVWQAVSDNWHQHNWYEEGDEIEYEGTLYRAQYWNEGEPPSDSYAWNALTSEWHPTNTYDAGDTVIYEGETYEAHEWNQGESPEASYSWQALTDEWRYYNTYEAGDEVVYQGSSYEASWWSQGDRPDQSLVWQASSTEQWHPNSIYEEGDEVTHGGDRFVAQYWTEGDPPQSNHGEPGHPWERID